MTIPAVRAKFVAKTLVYKHVGAENHGSDRKGLDGSEWVVADQRIIRSLFVNHGYLRKKFSFFLDAGYFGLILVRDGQWLSYGWCAQPRSLPPPHLPAWVRTLDAYWVFYCHTKENFRGRGVYKQLLRVLLAQACEKHRNAVIYADTFAENAASRQAMLSSGFRPCGTFTTYKLWVPRIGNVVLTGSWRRQQPHPHNSAEEGAAVKNAATRSS